MHFDWRPSLPLTCPECLGDAALHRSRIRLYEWPLLLVTGARPYRCHGCGWRVWVRLTMHSHA